MDAVKFLIEITRMCRQYPDCHECPLYMKKCHLGGRKTVVECREMVAAVEKWSKEHPLKTNGMVILEKLAMMDVPCVGTAMNGLKQKMEIEIDAEWWVAEYKEGSNVDVIA